MRARDEMAASVQGVRDRVDSILTHLERVDDRARAAAHGVGDQFRLHGGEVPHDQEADAPTGEVPPTEAVESDVVSESVEDTGSTPAAMPSVDELFARIRAGSQAATTHQATRPAPERAPAPERDEAPGEPGAPSASAPTEVVPVVAPAPEVAEATEPAEGEPEPDPLVVRRDELLAPASARLSRSVKRALGDDQNRLLDLLRNKPTLQATELLGPEDEHIAVFAKAARKQLGDAFAAGAVFGGAEVGSVTVGDAVDQTALGLARTIVALLRRQITEGAGDVADRVGAGVPRVAGRTGGAAHG